MCVVRKLPRLSKTMTPADIVPVVLEFYGDAKWPQHPLERRRVFNGEGGGFGQLIAERASLTDSII